MISDLFKNVVWSSSLLTKLLIPIVLVFALGIIISYQTIPAMLKSNTIEDVTQASKSTAEQYKSLRRYYIDNVTSKVSAYSDIRISYDHKNDGTAIPLPDTMIQDLSQDVGLGSSRIKLYSPLPFLNREERQLNEFGAEAWQFLKVNPEKPYVKTYDLNGRQMIRVAIADVMTDESCVSCHNSHELSPKTDWSLGELRGVLEMESDITNQLAKGVSLANRIVLLLMAMIAVTLLVIIWTFRYRIARPLEHAINVSKGISDGNLISHDHSLGSDEVGRLRQSLRLMKSSLSEVIYHIRSGADDVSEAAEQVSRGNSNLSQRTQEQASSLEEVASSMEEMTATVNQNAENAAKAKELAIEANEHAKKSGVIVSSTVGAMAQIESSSKRIAEIISVIDNIAFQTNLLALNAAVEAARAGEQGRGFAVVASEVRSLAARSAEAAKEIKVLIDDSVSKVKDGSDLVDDTGMSLAEITMSVQKVTEIVAEIAAASKEQSEGINQVNRAIVQMDEMTQSNASLVEQAAAASEAMGAQAEELSSLVAYFKVSESVSGNVQRVEHKVPKIRDIPNAPPPQALPEKQHNSAEDDGEWKDF